MSPEVAQLEGPWVVSATTFPMWLSGARRTPTFLYSNFREAHGAVHFDDTVSYVDRRGARRTIEGVDTVVSTAPRWSFRWRGKGWLVPFTSRWSVLELSAEAGWALIAFSATLATPAGLDVIHRPDVAEPPLERSLAAAGAEHAPLVARVRRLGEVFPP